MCGICGTLRFDGEVVDRALISRMCDTIVHRGPDAEGIYVAPGIGLGQRRLAIIDLSDAAVAPLSNEDETVWVTLNGEIYNFRELRADLCARGHRFRTATDTEVIVHLYEEYGTDCLARLHGMFAFALWDARIDRLLLARDRLGKKPLVYARTGRGLSFGSAIRAVTVDPDVSVAPDLVAIDRYLTYQFVPSPLTAFQGIHKVPPGHFLVCDRAGDMTVERYWSPPLPSRSTAPEAELADELVERLREAVRARMIADVPIGAFLSGGIDSGSVVALMAEASSRPVKTFSIGFEESGFDESADARLVAERYGTDHHELVVRPNALEVLPLLVHHYNEPFADSSAIPTYYVSKITREHVTVALSGDGADESFAGYVHYRALLAWEATNVIPYFIRRPAARLAEAALGALPYHNTVARLERGAQMLGKRLPARFHQQLSMFKTQEKRAAYTPKFHDAIATPATRDCAMSVPWDPGMDPLGWMLHHDQSVLLPEDFMVKVDVASMANALEVRSPFMDHRLVEFAATIPSDMKRRGDEGKLILKRAVRRFLPERTLAKPKTGFGMPLARWLRTDLLDLLRGALLDDRATKRGLFERRFIAKMVDDHTHGRRDFSNRLWALLVLELWFREFVD